MKKAVKWIFRNGKWSKPIRELIYHVNPNLIKKSKFIITKVFYCDCCMLVNTEDSYGIDVVRRGIIETPEDEYLKKIINKRDFVLDIGAHWGGFSILFGMLVGKYGRVFSFEPSKKNYRILKKNIKINKLDDYVIPFNFAVGNEFRLLNFPLSQTSSGHNSLVRKDIPIITYEQVQQVKLDDFLNEKKVNKVNFIKIDIEGYELEALKGLEKTIKNSENLKMLIEYSPSFMGYDKAMELLEFLKQNFQDVFICYKKKIFKTTWEDALKISVDTGQRNLFLFK
ncbi:FkbM family methyltransferase [Sulfurihydrogenibium sp.]|uniref:FkbM family methyltransferase n=1 Tax=Sulfurihydrogenibium sp. TaxID=2053621 RepID=UPI00260379BF|nr:FkbM family methyltransferase [Sulfurihydrogenibium sp.]